MADLKPRIDQLVGNLSRAGRPFRQGFSETFRHPGGLVPTFYAVMVRVSKSFLG